MLGPITVSLPTDPAVGQVSVSVQDRAADSGSDQPLELTPVGPIEKEALGAAGGVSGNRDQRPDVRCEESMAELVLRVSASHFPHGDPCIQFLEKRGISLCDTEGLRRFARDPSPLEGRRW